MQVVPIPDPHILAKIHQTYRIGYIKVLFLFMARDVTKNANMRMGKCKSTELIVKIFIAVQDVILPNILDNPTASSLNSMILNNNVMVNTISQIHLNYMDRICLRIIMCWRFPAACLTRL